jgi:hypothetical protein
MQSRKEFRVIEGGNCRDSLLGLPVVDFDQLRERTFQLRFILALSTRGNTVGLVDDMEEAIGALQRLTQSGHSDAPRLAAEYRVLIAEIDAEILAVLNGD